MSGPMTADNRVCDLEPFRREVLNLGQVKVPCRLHTVLQRFIPCKSPIPFTVLPHLPGFLKPGLHLHANYPLSTY